MRTVAIIQARLGSTRLPGKVLADVCGKPLLQRVVDRVRECDMVDSVVIAIPEDEDCSPLADLCAAQLWADWMAPEDVEASDVLGRFAAVQRFTDAGIIVRITGDCPLVDPALVDEQVRYLLETDGPHIVDNGMYPRGATGEVFGARLLRRANREATTVRDREHVKSWMLRLDEDNVAWSDGPDDDHRWCVDEQADLDFVRAVYEHLDDPLAGWREVLRVVEEHDLARINAHVRQKAVGE